MGINAQGIYEWDGDETFPEWRDDLTASITATVADINSDISAIVVPADSGWVNISTFGTGWSAVASPLQPRIRKVGDRVDMTGAVARATTTGLITNVFTIPVGYRPSSNAFIGTVLTSGGQAMAAQIANGATQLTFPAAYATAAIGSGVNVELGGLFWYVN